MERDGTPSDCMRESILWRMHQQRFDETIEPLELFEEAYTTKHRMVRIYKVLKVSEESKAWRAAKGIECASESAIRRSWPQRSHSRSRSSRYTGCCIHLQGPRPLLLRQRLRRRHENRTL